MSAEATFWAWEQAVSSTQKLTLLALANCHNESTGQCNPSISYLADRTGLNRKTVMKSLSELEEIGLIIANKKGGASTCYTIKTGTKNGTGTKTGTGTKNGTQTGTKNGTEPEPNLGHESKKNLKRNLKTNLPAKLNHESWCEWVDYRARRKAITELAAKKQISLLIQYDFATQAEIINRSISNDYQGLFPPRGQSNAKNQSGGNPVPRKLSAVERVEENIRQRRAQRAAEENHDTGGNTLDENGQLVRV